MQLRHLQRLGVNVRTGNLGLPGSVTEPGSSPALWTTPGSSPTLQRLTLDLHGRAASAPPARIVIETEFVFDRTGGMIGPERMRLVHRAASGGLVKLTRYVCSKAEGVDSRSYGRVDSRGGAELSYLPIDYCVLGSTEQHARTAQFLVLHHYAHSRMHSESAEVFGEVYQP